MRRDGVGIGLAVAGMLAATGAPLTAQSGTAEVTVGGYAQGQFRTSNAEGADPANTFEMRRVRPRIEVDFGNGMRGRLEADLAGGEVELRHAWLALTLGGTTFRAGSFKKPFGLIINTSSSVIPVLERGVRVKGLAAAYVTQAPDLPLWDDEVLLGEEQALLEAFGYQDYDIGASVSGLAGPVRYELGVFNGSRTAAEDDDDGKTVAGRVVYPFAAGTPIELGAGVSYHSRDVDGEGMRGTAVEVDLRVGVPGEAGTGVLAEVVTGDSFADDATFRGAQGMIWHHRAVASTHVTGVEGVARISWGDPDSDRESDSGLLLSPGFNVHLGDRTRLMTGWDIFLPQDDRLDTGHAFTTRVQIYF